MVVLGTECWHSQELKMYIDKSQRDDFGGLHGEIFFPCCSAFPVNHCLDCQKFAQVFFQIPYASAAWYHVGVYVGVRCLYFT